MKFTERKGRLQIEIDAKIREDWFCRSGFVHLNIYCKGVMPDKCSVKCDGLVLLLKIVHGFGTKETEKKYELFDAIEVGESKVISLFIFIIFHLVYLVCEIFVTIFNVCYR